MRLADAILAFALISVPISGHAYEGSRKHEISAGTSGGVFDIDEGTSGFISAYVSHGYEAIDLQLRTRAGLRVGKDSQGLSILVGPTFNFPYPEIENAWFITPFFGIQLSHVRTVDVDLSIEYFLELGKRFEIRDGIMWVPALTIYGGNFDLTLLQFSFFL